MALLVALKVEPSVMAGVPGWDERIECSYDSRGDQVDSQCVLHIGIDQVDGEESRRFHQHLDVGCWSDDRWSVVDMLDIESDESVWGIQLPVIPHGKKSWQNCCQIRWGWAQMSD